MEGEAATHSRIAETNEFGANCDPTQPHSEGDRMMNREQCDVVLGLLRNCMTIINRQKKRENARESVKKALANGSYLGRPRKRNDKAIWKLHEKGLTVRAIAKIEGVSTTAVQRSIKERRAQPPHSGEAKDG